MSVASILGSRLLPWGLFAAALLSGGWWADAVRAERDHARAESARLAEVVETNAESARRREADLKTAVTVLREQRDAAAARAADTAAAIARIRQSEDGPVAPALEAALEAYAAAGGEGAGGGD